MSVFYSWEFNLELVLGPYSLKFKFFLEVDLAILDMNYFEVSLNSEFLEVEGLLIFTKDILRFMVILFLEPYLVGLFFDFVFLDLLPFAF